MCAQVRDDNLAFVQTCWTFINSDSLLTWAQKVGLDFHFAVEQRARSFLGHFFNFNGTAGVLRLGRSCGAGQLLRAFWCHGWSAACHPGLTLQPTA